MELTSGRIKAAQKVVIYGPEGIGKSTFAGKFPRPVFCDTEGSTKHMDVVRTPKPLSWPQLIDQVDYFTQNPDQLDTFVLDTSDWAERMCVEHICSKAAKAGIEDFGYGKGFTYLVEEFGKLLNKLEDLIEAGVHVVLTAHAKMRKFEQPDEMGAYDRWEMKLSKTVAPLVKEWADMVLFATYKTYVVNVDGQGTEKGKNKAQGGRRVIKATHHPCWDAKNRHDLPDEANFEYGAIAHLFAEPLAKGNAVGGEHRPTPRSAADYPPPNPPAASAAPRQTKMEPAQRAPEPPAAQADPNAPPWPEAPQKHTQVLPNPPDADIVPPALEALMAPDEVTPGEIRYAVFNKGYFPLDMMIRDYPEDFVKGVLIGAWPKVLEMVKTVRNHRPF